LISLYPETSLHYPNKKLDTENLFFLMLSDAHLKKATTCMFTQTKHFFIVLYNYYFFNCHIQKF